MSRSLCTLFVLGTAAVAQGEFLPLTPFPDLGPGVISRDAAGATITSVRQLELRSIGNGRYRAAATVTLQSAPDSTILTGEVDLLAQPVTWTPNNHLALLNSNGNAIDEFCPTLSADGRIVVFDHYLGRTWPAVANNDYCFVCRRQTNNVQFQPADVRAVRLPYGYGFKDPHLGQELPNGNVLLFYSDAAGDVSHAELDPATGNVANPTTAAIHSQALGFGYTGSNYVLRDSTGAARALLFGEYWQHPTTNQVYGDMYWTEGVDNDGSPVNLTNAGQSPNYLWYANGSALGGTFFWARAVSATNGYTDPMVTEVCCVANTDLRSGQGRIAAFAPIRPRGNGAFLSVVAIGSAAAPYQIPPVLGMIELLPTIGVTDVAVHDRFTGLAEWAFANVPVTGMAPALLQVVTLDVAQLRIIAGNTATLRLP